MSDDYKPISFKSWTDDEPTRYPAPPERVIIVDGDLRAQLAETVARLRQLEVWVGVQIPKLEKAIAAVEAAKPTPPQGGA